MSAIPYVSFVVYELIRQGGARVDLEDFLVEANMSPSKSKEFVHTLNRRRQARGYRKGPLEIAGAMTMAIPVGVSLVFYEIFESDEIFTLRGVREGGSRIMYTGCTIADEIDESSNADGTVELSLSLKATGFTNR